MSCTLSSFLDVILPLFILALLSGLGKDVLDIVGNPGLKLEDKGTIPVI